MYAKVYQYKFPGVSEAKIAASFCADTLGKKIVDFNFQGLNVMIGKDGDLSIIIKFLKTKGTVDTIDCPLLNTFYKPIKISDEALIL